MTPYQRRIDRVLGPEYVETLNARSLDQLREMQAECAEVETEVSYVRRLAQARIDILQAELDRRSAGGSLGDLIDALPKILADPGPRASPVNSRIAQPLAPSMSINWSRGLERLVSDATLANLPTLSDEELRTTVDQLRELEHEVSETRHTMHDVIDRLDREVGVRMASVE